MDFVFILQNHLVRTIYEDIFALYNRHIRSSTSANTELSLYLPIGFNTRLLIRVQLPAAEIFSIKKIMFFHFGFHKTFSLFYHL